MAQYPAYWHNPYFVQGSTTNNLSPDTNAFGIGPPPGSYSSGGIPFIDVLWMSPHYNTGDSYFPSHSDLIKDENDTFYAIGAAWYTDHGSITIGVFNEDLEIDTYYEDLLTDEFMDSDVVKGDGHQWYIYKRSDTLFDFIYYYGDVTSLETYILHYQWTYGASSLTRVNWISAELPQKRILTGKYLGGFLKTGYEWVAQIYDIESMTYSTPSVVDITWASTQISFDYDYVTLPGGSNLNLVVVYGYCYSQHDCVGWLGGHYMLNDAAVLKYATATISEAGVSNIDDELDRMPSSPHAAYDVSLGYARGYYSYGIDLSTNTTYFPMTVLRKYGDPVDHGWCCDAGDLVPLAPCPNVSGDYELRGTWALCGGGLSQVNDAYVYASVSYLPDFPSRGYAFKMINYMTGYAIYDYKSGGYYLTDILTVVPEILKARGQRRDDGPVLFEIVQYVGPDEHMGQNHYDYIWYTLDGEPYAWMALAYSTVMPNSTMGRWLTTRSATNGGIVWGFPYIESEKGIFVQTVNLETENLSTSPTEALSLGEPEKGDRAAWNIFEYPDLHASDIYNNHCHYHSPEPEDVGQSPIWNGTKWLPGYVLTSGSGEYGWEDHWHLEEDITDLLHNAKLIQDVWVDEIPIDNEYLMYDLTSGSYITEDPSIEETILGIKELGFYTAGSFGTGGSFGVPVRLLSPWNGTIQKVILSANVAPSDQDIIVDVNKNGTTIFTDQDHRPVITTGSFGGETTDIDVADFIINDVFTIDLDQVGTSGSPGSDVITTIVVET